MFTDQIDYMVVGVDPGEDMGICVLTRDRLNGFVLSQKTFPSSAMELYDRGYKRLKDFFTLSDKEWFYDVNDPSKIWIGIEAIASWGIVTPKTGMDTSILCGMVRVYFHEHCGVPFSNMFIIPKQTHLSLLTGRYKGVKDRDVRTVLANRLFPDSQTKDAEKLLRAAGINKSHVYDAASVALWVLDEKVKKQR